MPVEIETFGDTNQQASVGPGTTGVIEDFDPARILVSCYSQDQGGAIQVVEGKAGGYDVLLFAKDDDFTGQVLTGEILDPTTPVKFSGSSTIGIATRTWGRAVFLRHVPSQGPEPEEALPAPTATVR